MLDIPTSMIFYEDGEQYVKNLYFPAVGTFIRLNTNLAKNNVRTLTKLAKGLGISRYTYLRKSQLIEEIHKHIQFP